MTTKQAVPQGLPPPQNIAPEEMDNRALQFAATALIERLAAVDNDVDDLGVTALVFNLQNLMRLFDRPAFTLDLTEGTVVFTRTVLKGDWETGRWNLAWESRAD
ncbi:MAG: hypothetical protein OXI41_11555 [Chloroflexota bacterium]|nr:hypothetical protein [Chloroflexota bacterium]MDE2894675.1 hypothetical protein [Chloroflexota bacterium]